MDLKNMKWGWKKDSLDPQFLHFASTMPRKKIRIPSFVDLEPQCSPVEDQSRAGSCTANALVGALEFLEQRQEGEFSLDLSRLFLYFCERELEGTIKSDSGAELRNGIRALASIGVCSEKTWPYDLDNLFKRPSKECYEEAANHKILKYYRVSGVDGMRECLARGLPFVFGFAVFSSFGEIGSDGIMPFTDIENEEMQGGHAVMCVGFDQEKRIFKIRNSWGDSWGDCGYFYMSEDFIADKRLCSDFWAISHQEDII